MRYVLFSVLLPVLHSDSLLCHSLLSIRFLSIVARAVSSERMRRCYVLCMVAMLCCVLWIPCAVSLRYLCWVPVLVPMLCVSLRRLLDSLQIPGVLLCRVGT